MLAALPPPELYVAGDAKSGGKDYDEVPGPAATKILRSIFSITRIAIAIASPTGHMCIIRRSLRLVVTLVGGILEYECLGTRIGRARCGARAPLGSHDEEDGGRWRCASPMHSFFLK